MPIPETKYAKSGEINLAYQVLGNQGEYLVFIPGWVTNVEECWNIPQLSAWLYYLASMSRLVLFDKRGTGLSDTVNEHDLPDIEQRASDLHIIMDAIGIESANFIGLSEGGPLAIYFAANFPKKVKKLILIGSFAKWLTSEDYPYGLSKEQHHRIKHHIFENWGKHIGLTLMAPSVRHNETAQHQWSRFLRRSASPNTAKVFYEMNIDIDVRDSLPKVMAQTLILHRKQDALITCAHSEYMHERISHSQLEITDGKDHLPWFSTNRNELIMLQTFLNDGKAINNPKLDMLSVEDIFTLYSMRDYIQNNYQEPLSIQSLSKHFGINDFKVKTGFKLLFHSPVITFLIETRLKQACQLLRESKLPISVIAEEVGYGHSNNFSVAFKRKYHVSPLEYRLTNRQG
ncbi:MAG: alpha/beta fold hydrolase [Bacteroidota bacterium]